MDVTSSVQKWQSGWSPNYGWIWEPTGSNGVVFHSSSGATPPKLTITYTEAPTEVVEVAAEYTADELLPSSVAASDLLSSDVYKNAKKIGLAAALAVQASDINITGFALGADVGDDRRLSTANNQLSGTVSVKTSFTVTINDSSTVVGLYTTIHGASTDIQVQTDSALAAADWSGQSVITSAPTITGPILATPVIVAALSPTASPTPSPTASPTPSPTASPTPSPTPSPAPTPAASPTPSPAPNLSPSPIPSPPVSATGDPHLQNILGQRFDLMQPGKHILINIPRGQHTDRALLLVQADASRFGGACAEMYFREVNVTGSWAEAKQAGGYHFGVWQQTVETPEWVAFGKLQLKIVHGRTHQGIQYLNVYVKHLGQTGYAVGGLLGEDDHTDVTIPPASCHKRVALGDVDLHGQALSVSSFAVAGLA
jgi:hypothetical protein